MAFGKLKETEKAADGIQRFARFHGGSAAQSSGWYRTRLGPAFKDRFSVIVAQASKVGIHPPKRKSKLALEILIPP
jgi:hypothetical protein